MDIIFVEMLLIHKVFKIKNQISERLKNLSPFSITGDLRYVSLEGASYHSKVNKVSVRNTKGGTILYFIQGTNMWKNPISYLSILEPE